MKDAVTCSMDWLRELGARLEPFRPSSRRSNTQIDYSHQSIELAPDLTMSITQPTSEFTVCVELKVLLLRLNTMLERLIHSIDGLCSPSVDSCRRVDSLRATTRSNDHVVDTACRERSISITAIVKWLSLIRQHSQARPDECHCLHSVP